jgi:hypothetical protein
VSKVRSNTELCDLRVSVESYVTQMGSLQSSAASASDTRSETVDTRHSASRVGAPPPLSWVLRPAGAATVLTAEVNKQRITGAV